MGIRVEMLLFRRFKNVITGPVTTSRLKRRSRFNVTNLYSCVASYIATLYVVCYMQCVCSYMCMHAYMFFIHFVYKHAFKLCNIAI